MTTPQAPLPLSDAEPSDIGAVALAQYWLAHGYPKQANDALRNCLVARGKPYVTPEIPLSDGRTIDALQARAPAVPDRDVLARVMADAQWLKKHPGTVPPMWFVVRNGAPDDTEASHFWRKALISADALIAAWPGLITPADGGWRPIETAPKDGTLLQLLLRVDPDTRDGFDGGDLSRVMGFNNFDNDDEDIWKFPGWDWNSDFIKEQGDGVPIMWAPMQPLPSPPASSGGAK